LEILNGFEEKFIIEIHLEVILKSINYGN